MIDSSDQDSHFTTLLLHCLFSMMEQVTLPGRKTPQWTTTTLLIHMASLVNDIALAGVLKLRSGGHYGFGLRGSMRLHSQQLQGANLTFGMPSHVSTIS